MQTGIDAKTSNKRTATSGTTRTTATKKTRTAKTAEREPSTIKNHLQEKARKKF